MDVLTAIKRRRTIRKFRQKKVPLRLLKELVNAARLAPSGGNLQALKYLVIDDAHLCAKVGHTLQWAAYLAPHGGPDAQEKPHAYIVVLHDTSIQPTGIDLDAGAAIQTMLLVAEARGVGAAWIGSIERKQLTSYLKLPSHFKIVAVIALGYKAQQATTTPYRGSIQYWRDRKGTVRVPKRPLRHILFHNQVQ